MAKEFIEDKQNICNAILNMLRQTSQFGNDNYNSLVELRFIERGEQVGGEMSPFITEEGYAKEDIVRPIFKDGTGKSGYYDCIVTMDSGIAMIKDVMTQFVFKM